MCICIVFCINGKHGEGTHSAKMGAYKLAKNTPNAKDVFKTCILQNV